MGAVLSGDPECPSKKREDSGIDFMEETINDIENPSDNLSDEDRDKNLNDHH